LRYHQLFRDILLHELNRTAAAEIPGLHRRAAQWYAEHGDPHQAIRHAVAAGDRRTTANLIAAAWRPTFNAGQLRTVESWLGGLPEEAVTADPRLTTARLWLAMDAGRLDSVEVELRRIEAAGPLTGDARLIRALHTFKTGDVTGAAARLGGIDPGGDAFDLTVRSLLIGVTALWQGALDRARLLSTRRSGWPTATGTGWPVSTRRGAGRWWRPWTGGRTPPSIGCPTRRC